METYLNKAEVCEVIGLHKQTLYEWMRSGLMMEPDVSVGIGNNRRPAEGYSLERAQAYGQYCHLLDSDNRPIPLGVGPQRHRPRPPWPSWWYANTRVYLGKPDLAELWGMSLGAVHVRAWRDNMPTPAVTVGTKHKAAVYGYTREEAITFARQSGIKVKVVA